MENCGAIDSFLSNSCRMRLRSRGRRISVVVFCLFQDSRFRIEVCLVERITGCTAIREKLGRLYGYSAASVGEQITRASSAGCGKETKMAFIRKQCLRITRLGKYL